MSGVREQSAIIYDRMKFEEYHTCTATYPVYDAALFMRPRGDRYAVFPVSLGIATPWLSKVIFLMLPGEIRNKLMENRFDTISRKREF